MLETTITFDVLLQFVNVFVHFW